MRIAKSLALQHQEPVASVGMPARLANPSRRPDWRQRLHLWGVERRRARFQRLEVLWDAPHEQVWTQTAYSYRDFVIQTRGPALRLALYHHLALS